MAYFGMGGMIGKMLLVAVPPAVRRAIASSRLVRFSVHNDSTEDAIYDSPVCSREGGVDAVSVSHSVPQP